MTQSRDWTPLYRAGGIAALLAAILFRRNIGAEVSLFTGAEAIPHSAADWYALLQSNPFVGLSFLAVFDLVDYALVGIIFLALAAALWSSHRSIAAIALASGLVGVAVGLASNISLTIFFAPSLRAFLMAAGGLFWMIWHLLVGLRLLQLSKEQRQYRKSRYQALSRLCRERVGASILVTT